MDLSVYDGGQSRNALRIHSTYNIVFLFTYFKSVHLYTFRIIVLKVSIGSAFSDETILEKLPYKIFNTKLLQLYS